MPGRAFKVTELRSALRRTANTKCVPMSALANDGLACPQPKTLNRELRTGKLLRIVRPLKPQKVLPVHLFLRMEEPARRLVVHLPIREHELGQEQIAVWIVDFLSGEMAPDLVFAVVIIAVRRAIAGRHLRKTIGHFFLALVHHDQLRVVPRLTGPSQVPPELRMLDEVAPTDKPVAAWLAGDRGLPGSELLLDHGIDAARE